MKKRVLLIVETMFPLGPAQQLSLLARELVKRGYEVHIAVLQDRRGSPYRVPSECQVHHLEIQKRDWMAWNRLRKLANAIDPDICHDWSAEPVTRAAIGGRYAHVSSQYDARRRPIQWSNWMRKKWIARQSVAPTQYVATHKLVVEQLVAQGISDDCVTMIPPAVATEIEVDRVADRQYVLEKFGLPDNSVIVGSFAPLIPATRFKDSIWAIDLLNCVRDDMQLLIMGRGSQLSRLRRFLRCTMVRSRVHFVDLPSEPLRVLSSLDVYWNSHVQWPLPISMLNAMRFGVPAISVHGPETEEVVIHQTTGFCVNLGARDEFARWTKYLVEQKESAKQLSDQGQEHVRQMFPIEPFVEAYLTLYRSF